MSCLISSMTKQRHLNFPPFFRTPGETIIITIRTVVIMIAIIVVIVIVILIIIIVVIRRLPGRFCVSLRMMLTSTSRWKALKSSSCRQQL